MLSKEEILEFKRLCEAEFGEKLTVQEAHDRAVAIIALFELLIRELPPDPRQDSENN